MDELLKSAANFGFPMVVAFYLLLRIEPKLDALTTSINNLNSAVINMNSKSSNSSPNSNSSIQVIK